MDEFHSLRNTILKRLSSFNISDLYPKNGDAFADKIKAIDMKEVAKGAFGSFSLIKGVNHYGIKTILPSSDFCDGRAYQDLKSGIIYTVPYPENLIMRSIPIPVSEVAVAAIMTELTLKRYCLGYTKMFSAVLTNDLIMYIVVELLKTNPLNLIVTEGDFIHFLFQICFDLMVGQEMAKFTHYDLHTGNVLYTDPPDCDYIVYPLLGRRLYVKRPKFQIKISDYGMSRAQYENVIITSTSGDCTVKNDGVFNPYFDILRLLFSMDKYIFTLKENFRNKIFKIVFGTLDIGEIRKTWGSPEGFPKGSFTGVNIVPMKPLMQILYELGDVLASYSEATYTKPIGRLYELQPLPEYNLSTGLYDPDVKEWPYYIPSTSFDGINVLSSNQTMITEKSDHTFVYNSDRLSSCGSSGILTSSQKIIEVWTSNGKSPDGFEFDFPCCKVDPIDYLTTNDLEGFVINGGIYDPLRSFLPTAPFKNNNMQQDANYIYEAYRSLYGTVMIDKSGKIVIGKLPENRSDLLEYTVAGPMMIYRGKEIITEKLIRESYIPIDGKMVPAFECASDPINIKVVKRNKRAISESCVMSPVQIVDIQNCNTLPHGSLGDISNERPRMIIILLNDNRLGCISVTGDGMSLLYATKWLQARFGSSIEAAIAVGASNCRLAIRKPEDDTIYINTEEIVKKPEGSLIAYIRKRGVKMDINT
jgi:hypothetical protein